MKKFIFSALLLLLCSTTIFAQVDIINSPSEVDEQQFTIMKIEEPERPNVTELPSIYGMPVKKTDSYKFAIRTNMLHWVAMTPNVGIEYRISPTWGIRVDGGWAKWNLSTNNRYWGVSYVNPELRCYLGQSRNFYVGAAFTMGQFDIFMPAISHNGHQGNFMGGGGTIGYQLPVNSIVAIDFNIGIGYTHIKYDTYSDDLVRINRDLTKTLHYPSQAGVSLIWKLNRNK